MSHLVRSRLLAISISILTLNALNIHSATGTEASVQTDAPVEKVSQQPAAQSGLGLDIGLQPIIMADNSKHPSKNIIALNNPRQPLGLGVTARVGTLGIGIDIAKSLTSQVNGRLGFNFGNLNVNRTDSGINYDSQLNLSSIQLVGDYYPFRQSNFRVTGGLVAQNNKLTVTSKPNAGGNYTIDNQSFPASSVGTLSGEFKSANSIAPYLGIGIGQPATEGLAFNADLGLMFAGAPQVTLNASNPAFNGSPITRSLIDNQARQTENDLKGLNLYPVVSVGVSYGF
ncbi:MAG: hypothetical protein RLZZ135_1844 [Cyanobacteriota bacterium]